MLDLFVVLVELMDHGYDHVLGGLGGVAPVALGLGVRFEVGTEHDNQ